MPSKKQYNLVSDDAYDSRIPLYNEEAFQHGITFHAKYIGSLDVPRPSSRVEIVAAMRRIRYEFKAKSIKKRKVALTVSVDGVKVIPRSKRRNNRWPWEDNKFIILHHPIYRIFYVSHDSQDLKIFSYIARDGGTNAFKCNVFKSKKKSQAMRIVRTVGQAFEVCHKLSLSLATSNACEEAHSISGNDEADALHEHSNKDFASANKGRTVSPSTLLTLEGKSQGDGASEPNSCDTQEEQNAIKPMNCATNQCSQHTIDESPNRKTEIEASRVSNTQNNNLKITDSNAYQHIQLLRDQLELQNQQLQSVVTQIQILRDQLTAEKSARMEAQDQNHLLLIHNRELLEHIQKLVNRIYEMEGKHFNNEKSNEMSGMSESFHLSPPPAPDAHQYLESIRYLSSIDKTGQPQRTHQPNTRSFSDMSKMPITAGHVENHFTADPMTKLSFSKQSSVLGSSQFESTTNPKSDVSFNNVGFSLPTSPNSNFSPSLDTLFKPDSFVCSSPKQPRKVRGGNPSNDDPIGNFLPTSYTPQSQSSTSPGQRNKAQNVFNFEQPPVAYSSSASLFNLPEKSGNSFNLNNNNSHSSLQHTSRESNASNQDSFIAQVTRDLAKMSTLDKCLSESSPGNKLYSDNYSLFKS